jgi:hypothetical protein
LKLFETGRKTNEVCGGVTSDQFTYNGAGEGRQGSRANKFPCARCVKIRSLRFEFDIPKNRRRKSVMDCASRIKQGRDRLPFGSRTKVDEEAILSPGSQLQSADASGFGHETLGAPTTAFYPADGNGNVTALTYPNQQLAAKYLYDPFGNTLTMSGPLPDFNKYWFSSKEWNENSGLYYYPSHHPRNAVQIQTALRRLQLIVRLST